MNLLTLSSLVCVALAFFGNVYAELESCHSGTHKPCDEGFMCKVSDLALQKGLLGATGGCVVTDICSTEVPCPFGYTCSEEGKCSPPVNLQGGICGTYANIACQEGNSCINNVCMPDVCSKPLVTGRCRALFRRWGFDPVKGECVQFVYGGCESNGNNFESKHACELRCPSSNIDVLDVEDLECSADVEVCPDSGAYIGRVGPDCEFNTDHCPEIHICTMDVQQCADGTFVGRIGKNCEFEPCPDGTLIKPDGKVKIAESREVLDDDENHLKSQESPTNQTIRINPIPIILVGVGAAFLAAFLLIRWRNNLTAPRVPHVEHVDEDESSA